MLLSRDAAVGPMLIVAFRVNPSKTREIASDDVDANGHDFLIRVIEGE